MQTTSSLSRFSRLADYYRAFWHQSPYKMSAIAFLLGVLPFIMVFLHGVGGLNFHGIMDSALLVRQDDAIKIEEVRRFRDRVNYSAGKGTQEQTTAEDRIQKERLRRLGMEPVIRLSEGVYLVDVKHDERGSGQASDNSLTLEQQKAQGQGCLADPFPASCQVFYVKNVGFLAALNWSVQLLILFPISIFFAFRVPQLFTEAVARMHDKGMLRRRDDAQEEVGLESDIVSFIRVKIWRRALGCGIVLFAATFLVMWYDWHSVVYTPLDCDRAGWTPAERCQGADLAPFEDSRENELDWSVSATFPSIYSRHYGEAQGQAQADAPSKVLTLLYRYGCKADRRTELRGVFDFPLDETACDREDYRQHYRYADLSENLVFSGYVYLVAAVLSALVLMFYGYLFCFAWTMEELSRRKYKLLILPNLRSKDLRRGFELLWPPIRAVIIATFVGYAVLYLMRIQNLFLRAQEYRDIFDFMARDLLSPFRDITLVVGKFLGGEDVGSLSGQITSTPETLERILDPGLNDTQAYISVVIFSLVTVIISILLIIALHDVASRAKQDVLDDLEESDDLDAFIERHPVEESVKGETREKKIVWVMSRVSDMVTWPLDWPTLNRAMKLLLIGILFLIFYRAMLIWIGLFVYAIVSGRAERKAKSA